VEDWLGHKLVQLRNMVLPFKVLAQGFLDVVLKRGALGDQRVDLLPFYLPGYSVNQEGVLYCIVLAEHWVQLDVFARQDLGVSVHQLVQLLDS